MTDRRAPQDRPSLCTCSVREGVAILQDEDSLHSRRPRDQEGQLETGQARRESASSTLPPFRNGSTASPMRLDMSTIN